MKLVDLTVINRESQRLFIAAVLLLCIGIVMIYSASSCFSYEGFHDSAYYLKRHLMHCLIGGLLAWFFWGFNYRNFKKYSRFLLLAAILSLMIAIVPGIGHEAGGAKRWIKIGFIGFQPSESASLFLIIYLADLLDRKEVVIRDFIRGFIPPLFVVGFLVLLILIQPDLGSAVSMLIVSFIMMFAAGVNMFHIVPFLILTAPVFYFLVFKVEYRLRRILSYLDPWGDMQGAGFQIVQSLLALGSGGILGVGLGASRQKLFYLPQAHTDFIFSIIGEELGLLGTLSVVVLFVVFIWHGIEIAVKAKDLFGKLLALGITSSIGLEAVINIAVSTGAMPTKGLPLPFISYGGTSLIFNIISVAILINISNS